MLQPKHDAWVNALAIPSRAGDPKHGRCELADDGTLNFFIDTSWTPVAAEGTYELRVDDGSVVSYYPCASTALSVPVTSGKSFSLAVRAIGADGTPGGWSPTSSITVTKKNTAPTSPSGFDIKEGVKRNKLSWDRCPDKDYKRTNVYRNTSNTFPGGTPLGHVHGTVYIDDAITIGANYWYWISHEDRSGNETAAVGFGAAKAAKAVAAADTDQTALSAPASLALALNYQDIDGDGTLDTTLKATWSALTDAVRYELEVSRSDTAGGTYTVIDNIVTSATLASFGVIVGKYYKARVRAFSFNGTAGSWSVLTSATQAPAKTAAASAPTSLTIGGVGPGWVDMRWSPSPDPDYAYSIVTLYPTTNDFTAATENHKYRAIGQHLRLPTFITATCFAWVEHVNNSGVKSAKYPTSDSGGVTVGVPQVGTAEIEAGAVSVWEKATPAGGYTVSASTSDDVATCTSNHTTDATDVEICGSFKNNTGAQRTIDITFRGGSTDLFTISGVTLPDGAYWSGSYFHNGPTGSSTSYKIRVTAGATAFTASARYISTKARKK